MGNGNTCVGFQTQTGRPTLEETLVGKCAATIEAKPKKAFRKCFSDTVVLESRHGFEQKITRIKRSDRSFWEGGGRFHSGRVYLHLGTTS